MGNPTDGTFPTMSRIGGDFKRFDARYEVIAEAPGRSRVTYDATIVPSTVLPSFLGVRVMRSTVGRQFDGLMKEIRRRARSGAAAM